MAPVRHRSPGRTADASVLAPWLLELTRTAPDLVRAYLRGGPVDARTWERVLGAVTSVNGDRISAWIHASWADYLGERPGEASEAEDAVLDYARAAAAAGRPLDPASLVAVLGSGAAGAVRATVAHAEVSNLLGNTVAGLLARLGGRRPLEPVRAVGEAATVAAAVPLAVPFLATAAAMRVVSRLAPAVPAVDAPADEEANLLVHVLARALPAYLANAGVRLVSLRLPVPLVLGVRAGRSAATVRVGRGRVAIENGVSPDALMVLEGDIEPLLQVATGSLLREIATLRLRRD